MGKNLPFRLILASGSPARRELLTRAGWSFEVKPAHIEEPTFQGSAANANESERTAMIRDFVHRVAWLKAAAVAPQVSDGIVLTADTVGWLLGQVLGKPADEADARRILQFLGGTTHELWTGVVLWRRPDDLQLAWQERTLVAFKKLTDAELDAYIATRQWEGCSGAYAIQENDAFIQIVAGSRSNVIGLPMERLEEVLGLLGCNT